MLTANQLKIASQLVGVVILQTGLFACYVADVWHNPVALLLIVLMPMTVLVVTYLRERNWFNRADKVIGQVIDRQQKLIWGTPSERLTVVYKLNGITYSYSSYRSLFSQIPSIGAPIELFYNTNKPAIAKERSALLVKVFPWIILAANAILLVSVSLYAFDIPDYNYLPSQAHMK